MRKVIERCEMRCIGWLAGCKRMSSLISLTPSPPACPVACPTPHLPQFPPPLPSWRCQFAPPPFSHEGKCTQATLPFLESFESATHTHTPPPAEEPSSWVCLGLVCLVELDVCKRCMDVRGPFEEVGLGEVHGQRLWRQKRKCTTQVRQAENPQPLNLSPLNHHHNSQAKPSQAKQPRPRHERQEGAQEKERGEFGLRFVVCGLRFGCGLRCSTN